MSKALSILQNLFNNKNASVEVFSKVQNVASSNGSLSNSALNSLVTKMGLPSLQSIAAQVVDIASDGAGAIKGLIKEVLPFDNLPDAVDSRHLRHIKNQIIDSIDTFAVLPMPLVHLKPESTDTLQTLKRAYLEGSSLVEMNGSEIKIRLIGDNPDAIAKAKALLPNSLHELMDLAKDIDIDAISFSPNNRQLRVLPIEGIATDIDRGHRLELVGMLKHEIYNQAERATTVSTAHLSERDIELLMSADDGSVTQSGQSFKIDLGSSTEKSDRHLKKHSQEFQDIITAARAVGVTELTFDDVAPFVDAHQYEDLRGESRFQIR